LPIVPVSPLQTPRYFAIQTVRLIGAGKNGVTTMAGALRRLEKRFRTAREVALRRLLSGRRGRKLVMKALGEDVVSVTLDCGDHVLSFSPHELVGRAVYMHGHFDRYRIDELFSILDKEKALPSGGLTVVEVGANIGTQSVYFGLSPRVEKVLAIEPDPRNLGLLRRNIADNALARKVAVVACAVGDFSGQADLYFVPGNQGQSSLLAPERSNASARIQVKPLQAILDETGTPAAQVDFVWMDIEGAEPMALRSMTALLERRVPINLEFSPKLYGPQGTRDFIQFLARYYERCVFLLGDQRTQMKVADIPPDSQQADILLLP
jgi:FkbM family methyltransferase